MLCSIGYPGINYVALGICNGYLSTCYLFFACNVCLVQCYSGLEYLLSVADSYLSTLGYYITLCCALVDLGLGTCYSNLAVLYCELDLRVDNLVLIAVLIGNRLTFVGSLGQSISTVLQILNNVLCSIGYPGINYVALGICNGYLSTCYLFFACNVCLVQCYRCSECVAYNYGVACNIEVTLAVLAHISSAIVSIGYLDLAVNDIKCQCRVDNCVSNAVIGYIFCTGLLESVCAVFQLYLPSLISCRSPRLTDNAAAAVLQCENCANNFIFACDVELVDDDLVFCDLLCVTNLDDIGLAVVLIVACLCVLLGLILGNCYLAVLDLEFQNRINYFVLAALIILEGLACLFQSICAVLQEELPSLFELRCPLQSLLCIHICDYQLSTCDLLLACDLKLVDLYVVGSLCIADSDLVVSLVCVCVACL